MIRKEYCPRCQINGNFWGFFSMFPEFHTFFSSNLVKYIFQIRMINMKLNLLFSPFSIFLHSIERIKSHKMIKIHIITKNSGLKYSKILFKQKLLLHILENITSQYQTILRQTLKIYFKFNVFCMTELELNFTAQ